MTTARRAALAGLAGAGLAAGLLPRTSHAQAPWPSRPVRVIVASSPGGGLDVTGRIIFSRLSETMGRQFVVENRAGGGGTIAEAAVAASAADGYTLLYDSTMLTVNPALHQGRLPYGLSDFASVFLSAVSANLMIVHPSVPERTVSEVIAMARAASGGFDWASSGNGSLRHLLMAMFARRAELRLNHIPYRGGGPALTALVGGEVKYAFANAATVTSHVRSGLVRAIAHTGRGRLAAMPDIPSVAETLPGFEGYDWNGVLVPVATPAAIVTRLNEELNAVARHPEVVARLAELNLEMRTNRPEEFQSFLQEDVEKWSRVIREAQIRVD